MAFVQRSLFVLVGFGFSLPGTAVSLVGHKTQPRQLATCTLEQHAKNEMAILRGRTFKQEECLSFREAATANRSYIKQPVGNKAITFARTAHGSAKRGLGLWPSFLHGVDYMSFIYDKLKTKGKKIDPALRTAVWINGYPRSGSSTILSMVAAAGPDLRMDSRQAGDTFSMFEPCHDGDEYNPWLEEQGCGRLLSDLAQCNFTGVRKLWGWADSHTTSNHMMFEENSATDLCEQATHVAFKTVDYGHNISEWQWFLDEQPRMRIIDIVRDPRGIYASWKTTVPFNQILTSGEGFYTLSQVCDTFAANIELNNPNVYHVVFERLTKDPLGTMRGVYEFLGMPMGEAQEQWVKSTFDAIACPEPKPWEVGFADCHENSAEVAEKWRVVLTPEEIATFDASPTCQKVVETYGFPSA